jgi:hypothetical protein
MALLGFLLAVAVVRAARFLPATEVLGGVAGGECEPSKARSGRSHAPGVFGNAPVAI